MKNTFSLFFLSLALALFPLVGFSQAADDDTGAVSQANTPVQTLDDQVNRLENILSQLEQQLSDNASTDETTKLLSALPISRDNIEQKIANLQQSTNTADTNKVAIGDADERLNAIKKIKATTERQLTQLSDGEMDLKKAAKSYLSLEQLFSNPVNQANASQQTKDKINGFSQKINSLKQQFSQQIEELSLQAEDLDNANSLLNRWKTALLSKELDKQQAAQQQTTDNSETIAAEQEKLHEEIRQLETQLTNNSGDDLKTIDEAQQNIYKKQTLIWLLNIDKELITLAKQPFIKVSDGSMNTLSLAKLEKELSVVLDTEKNLNTLKSRVETRYGDFQKYVDIVGAQPELDDAFTARMKAIAYRQLLIKGSPLVLGNAINDKKEKALFSLDSLYAQKAFTTAFAGIPDSILQMSYQIQISFKTLYAQILNNPFKILLGAVLEIGLILAVFFSVSHWLVRGIKGMRGEPAGFALTSLHLFRALRKHIVLFILMLFVVGLVRSGDIPYPSNYIIRALVYAMTAALVWFLLIYVDTRKTPYSRYAYVVTILLALFAAVYAVAYMSAVESSVLGLYEKFLMLAFIAFVWVERNRIRMYFSDQDSEATNKSYRLYLWVINFLPWVVIAVCVLSLVGFSHLAWLFLSYIGMGAIYVLALGLGFKFINYSRKKAKLYSLRRFEHGAFIASDMVSPLSVVVKVLWVWGATALLFHVMDWNSNSYLVVEFLQAVQYPLVKIGATEVNLQIIFLSVLALYIIFKMARWLRTFSYHWLYARIQDLGVRGSLSIFSQYVATVIGVLIALNILGIDLTSLAVFAGALGVGVGLGLQDIAKNFISGILLLIERPLRSGDWVSIDGTEGTVTSIGMRAITMETFDKQAVIIPNGNAISNSFVNNTHSDNILRTVLYIGAGYDSDPEQVMEILATILQETEAVLVEPHPRVVLWEYGDSSINYRIQYYINLENHGLFETRTAVLNRIWHDFKDHSVEIPFPQRDINFRNRLDLQPNPNKDNNEVKKHEENDE